MSFDIQVGKQALSIKFNYRTMFKVNKCLGTKDADGNKQEDGVSALFLKVIDRDDSGLIDFIKLFCEKKTSEEDVINALDRKFDSSDDEDIYEQTFQDLEDEMLNSGFFMKKIKKYQEKMEPLIPMLEKKVKVTKDEDKKIETEMQIDMIKKMQETLSKKTSSKHVQDSELLTLN